jgi:hypothetical protein
MTNSCQFKGAKKILNIFLGAKFKVYIVSFFIINNYNIERLKKQFQLHNLSR